MGSAFHLPCPRCSGTLTPTAPTAIKFSETFPFYQRFRSLQLVLTASLPKPLKRTKLNLYGATIGRRNETVFVGWWSNDSGRIRSNI